MTSDERIKAIRETLEEFVVLSFLPPTTTPRWRYIDRDDVAFLLAEYDKVKKHFGELLEVLPIGEVSEAVQKYNQDNLVHSE